MKKIRMLLKRFFAVFLCTGIISCSAFNGYCVAYAAGEEAAAAAGILGYIPFSTAFYSAAAALGVTGASLAGVLSQENGNADLTAAQKAAESAISKKSGLQVLSNGVSCVKSYVVDKVNYFSSSFMSAVAEALNNAGLLTSKSATVATGTHYLRKTLTASDFISPAIYYNNVLSGANKTWFNEVGDALLTSALDGYIPIYRSGYFLACISPDSLKDVTLVLSFSNKYIYSETSIKTDKTIRFNYDTHSVSTSTLYDDNFYDLETDFDIVNGNVSYATKNIGFLTLSLLNEYITKGWSVTSNTPKFGASALLESMPTWAASTTTIPANTVDSVAEAQTAYPVTIPASNKALTDGLTIDDVQDLTQDQAQAGSIDTTTDITDLAAVTAAITGAAEETNENFGTLFGWLDDILTAVKAIPASIADAITSAFAFQQSSLDGLMLPTEITKKFPFCIPFDIADCLKLFATDDREAPRYEYELKYGGQSETIVLDLSQFDGIAKLLRSLEFVAFLIGLAFATRYLIRG